MVDKITIELKALLEKNGKYRLETSYCLDGKCSPEYKPIKREAKKLIKMCLAAAETIKEVYG